MYKDQMLDIINYYGNNLSDLSKKDKISAKGCLIVLAAYVNNLEHIKQFCIVDLYSWLKVMQRSNSFSISLFNFVRNVISKCQDVYYSSLEGD